MEKMTEKEKELLKELKEKEKRIEAERKRFFAEADAHKDELLARWGITLTDEKTDAESSV